MEHIHESEFDLVVVGTGLIESIVAAAAARAGRSVLQVDSGRYYGGAWATLHLDELLAELWPGSSSPRDAGPIWPGGVSQLHVLRCPRAELGAPREYNIDLAPKALYGVGPMIELLLGSGAHHYTEFKLVQGSYLYDGGGLQAVPSSRAEVFRDRSMSLVQKRTLMRFLKACTDAMQGQGPLRGCFDGRPFVELMRQEGLDEQLQRFMAHGVLFLQSGAGGATAGEALQLMQWYVESTGRYGPDAGPLLTPMYGCGELSQAFCRVAAVAGAVQVLRCPVDGLGFDEHSFGCTGVELANGQAIRCRELAAGPAALRDWLTTFGPRVRHTTVHRCVAVLEAPLRDGEQQTLVVVPPGVDGVSGARAVWALCLCHSTAVCPSGRWLLHMWAERDPQAGATLGSPAHAALWPALRALVECDGLVDAGADAAANADAYMANGVPAVAENDDSAEARGEGGGESVGDGSARGQRPFALFAAFFTSQSASLVDEPAAWPRNVALCPGPGPEVTLSSAVEEAKRCYWRLYPGDSAEPFPLGSRPVAAERDADADSDEEALEALQAALGGRAAELHDSTGGRLAGLDRR